RRAQASAALNRAIALKPDLVQAHLSLAGLYEEIGYLDLTLNHLRAYERLSRDPSAPLANKLARLAEAVAQRENAYAVEAGNLRLVDRALLAFHKGLKGKARDLLLESDLSAFGPQGMALE